jgi:hypothetical protein
MKKWIIRLVIAGVVVVVVALVAVFLSLNTIVKKGVETVGPQLTKVEVKLGSASISPLSGGGKLANLFVGNPAGFKTSSAIKMGSVKVAVEIGSVLTDTIVVKEINIQSPEITFEGGLSGNNISKILDNVKAANGGDQPAAKTGEAAPAAQKSQKKFIVKDMVIEGAKLHASLTGLGGKQVTLPLPPLHLQNIGSPGNGVTPGELVEQILKPLLASSVTAVEKGITDIGKNVGEIGKDASKEVNKVTKGLKGLFNSK